MSNVTEEGDYIKKQGTKMRKCRKIRITQWISLWPRCRSKSKKNMGK